MNTLTITARALKALVAPVLPLAGKDDSLPVICAVLIETRGEYVTATATDRFRFGICRDRLGVDDNDKPTMPPTGWRALIPARDLRTILGFFKASRYFDPVLELAVDDQGERLTVTQGGGLDNIVGATLTVALEQGSYPAIETIARDALTATEAVSEQSFNAAFLGDFKHACRHGEPIVVRFGAAPGKPAMVTVGEHFLGGIMPRTVVKEGGASYDRGQWAEFLGGKAERRSA